MSVQQLEAILAASAENPPPSSPEPALFRQWFEDMNAVVPIAAEIAVETVSIGACEAELLIPDAAAPGKLIIYYHGGGFFIGSPRSHRMISSHLARHSQVTVLSVDYRLAPEHPAPAAQDDAFMAYQWALQQGYPANAIALTGDSAGGNLALATAVHARDDGLAVPGCIGLMSPALDLAGDGDSFRSEVDPPLLTRELAALFVAVYVADGDPRSAKFTPFYSDMTGMPPVLVHVGSRELLRDDSVTITERLQQSGCQAELKIWPGMCHSWQMFAPMLDEGMQSIEEMAAFIRQHL